MLAQRQGPAARGAVHLHACSLVETDMAGTTTELARFALSVETRDIPEVALVAARRSLLNFVGVTVAGATHPAVAAALEGLAELGTTGPVPVLGRAETLDAAGAALVNGISSAVLDFDSTQLKRTNIHPSGPVLPALLALAALRRIDGEDFLAAYVAGVDVACRIANGVFGRRNPGWHVTGVAGPIGAAVGVARLLRLDLAQTTSAIGIAASQSGGLREMYGTMCKAFIPGRAAQSGLYAALFAKGGMKGPAAPLEGRKGLAKVFADIDDDEGILDNLGTSFEIEYNTFKPYPCAIVAHATIDCARALRRRGVSPGAVARIEISVAPIAIELAGIAEPATGLEAKFSLAHCAASALLHDTVSVRDFSLDAIRNPEVRRLTRLCSRSAVPEYRKEQASLRITLSTGEVLEEHVPHALGSLENPMTDEDLALKFQALVAPVLGQAKAAQLLDRCMRIASEPDVGVLAMASRPPVHPAASTA